MSLLQRGRRPVADISYKDRQNQKSLVNSIRIGELVITEIDTDGFVSKTLSEPHLSFAIQLSGNGAVNEKGKATDWIAASKQIYSVSYAWPMLNDFGDFHGVFIRPSYDAFTKLISARCSSKTIPSEDLCESCATVYAAQYDGVEFRNQIEILLSIVKDANGDEAFLTRIGLDQVINSVLADLVVAHAGHEEDGFDTTQLSRSARAVDIICGHINQNIGCPLTIAKMEELSSLTGRALNYAFQKRFNCSPQEWQRNLLLDEARKRILNGSNALSIKNLSYELGFSSPSSFSAYYRRRFGMLPTKTVSRKSA